MGRTSYSLHDKRGLDGLEHAGLLPAFTGVAGVPPARPRRAEPGPVPIVLPCHRVLGANGSLTGYGGGLDRTEWLLRLEGALL